MKKFILIFFTAFSFPLFLNAQADAENCEDHPLITRFPGAHIVWCGEEKLAEYHVAIGKVSGYRQIDKWIDLEGRLFRYNYELHNSSATVSEVYQNYCNALQRAGRHPLMGRLQVTGLDKKKIELHSIFPFLRNPLTLATTVTLYIRCWVSKA